MIPTSPATALIADDDESPREQLRAALSRSWPGLRVVAEAPDGIEAWDAWLVHEPRVVFLDLRMPGLTGLDVAQRIRARAHVVFVAAPGDHALEAIAAAAFDVLVKPIDDDRVSELVARLATRLDEPPADPAPLLERLIARQRAPAPLDVLQTGLGHEDRPVRVDDVVYFEADARYTRVVHQGGDAMLRLPLKQLLARLDPQCFWQVHRSLIVNRRCIAGAQRTDADHMVIMLRERPERLPVARAFQGLFETTPAR